jgi:hypothetical protein
LLDELEGRFATVKGGSTMAWDDGQEAGQGKGKVEMVDGSAQ